MRRMAQANLFVIAATVMAILVVGSVGGCGKKGEEPPPVDGPTAAAPPGPGANANPPGPTAAAPGPGPAAPGPSAGPAAGPGPGAEPGAAPAPTAAAGVPSGPPAPVAPAPAPTPEQMKLVDDAIGIVRLMMTRNVPPPPPGSEPKKKGATAKSAAPGGPGGGPSGPAAGPGPGSEGPPPGPSASANPFGAHDYRLAQGGPRQEGPGGLGGPAEGGAPAPKAAPGQPMPPIALAEAIKKVCQKTRGVDLNGQKWFHEYWYFMAKNMLEKEVAAKFADFPLAQLSWAAQTRSDWEGFLWHWGIRKMLEVKNYSDLVGPTSPPNQDVVSIVAKARVALAAQRAICKYGLLMRDVDETKMGRIIWPTLEHTLNCIQLAYGNPSFDPATIQRDETKRSPLMVEVFDNYAQWGHNWWWERSRNWSYLARVSANFPAYKCPVCGYVLTRERAMWRCPRCGKGIQADIPGTDVVEPYRVEGKVSDDKEYQTVGILDPKYQVAPDGKYVLTRGWNSPTFARRQQGLRNAQRLRAMVDNMFTGQIPTQADMDAYKAWIASWNKVDKIPELHRMELEAHEMRLHNAAVPGNDRRN